MIKTIKFFEHFSAKIIPSNPLKSATCSFSTHRSPHKIELILDQYKTELESSKIVEKIAPRTFTEKDLQNLSYKLRYSGNQNHLESLNRGISAPIWDLLDRGGKRWRPVLTMLVA